MQVAGLAPLHTDIGVASHAHPSPVDDTALTGRAQRLSDLIAGMAISVSLRGLATKENATPYEVYYPRVRRSPLTEQAISHLDVVSCWKGISYSQALELVAWERLFQQCLAWQVEQRLQVAVIAQLGECEEPIDEISLLARVVECLSDKQQHSINIDIPRLIYDMIESFYNTHPGGAASQTLTWSLSSEDLPNFLFNFLRTQDCFLHTVAGPCLVVETHSYRYCGLVLALIANVTWQPPDIRFRGIPNIVRAGEQFYIAPWHMETTFGANLSTFKLILNHTYYTVSHSPFSLQWDPKGGCFRAFVPWKWNELDQSATVDEILLSAHIVTPFLGNVRFERTSRYSIKFDIVDNTAAAMENLKKPLSTPTVPWVPSYTSTPLSKTRPIDHHGDQSGVSSRVFTSPFMGGGYYDDPEEIDSGSPSQPLATRPALQDLPLDTFNANDQTPKKRKASQQRKSPSSDMSGSFALDRLEHRDLEMDTKRRKFQQCRDSGVHIDALHDQSPDQSIEPPPALLSLSLADVGYKGPADDDELDFQFTKFFTGPMGEAQQRPSLWFDKRENVKPQSPCQPRKPIAAQLKANAKQTVFSWRLANQSRKSSGSSPAASNNSDPSYISMPSDNGRSKQNTELTQEQIQHNYLEFEERAKRKAEEKAYYAAIIPGFDGVLSPNDERDKDFERIFLEDSGVEDWTSDVDGSSEDMETVNMDE